MVIARTQHQLDAALQENAHQGLLGLVPTMGALHKGHISLIERAVAENDRVVVSIFVNPTQFDNPDDLHAYPKTMAADISLLEQVAPDILVFAPDTTEVYGNQVISKTYAFNGLDGVMEGAFRKGHFDGVGTIVEWLLKTIAPQNAYFGEKDYQQLCIIKKLVALENIPVTIVSCPIVRETNGLAMSSRNARLSPRMRKNAGFIHDTLQSAKALFGTKNAKEIKEWVKREFDSTPDFQLEYFEIGHAEDLRPIDEKKEGAQYRGFIAVFAEGVRLIDNIALN